MMRRRVVLPGLLLAACQPVAEVADLPCVEEPTPPGEIFAGEVACPEMDIAGGEGRPADLWLSNSLFSAVIRHPQDSLTMIGVGGGTLIDAAPWDTTDRLHEAIPLVGGGWLDVQELDLGRDRVTLRGPIASLRDLPAEREGDWAEVSWVVVPDVPWLQLEGADGIYLHTSGDTQLLDGQLVHPTLQYAHDGVLTHDLGGAIRVDGADRLIIADPLTAMDLLGTLRVEGAAAGASRLVLFRGDEIVGRVPIKGTFDLHIPADVDGVRAEASDRASSPTVRPGTGLDLPVGAAGWVDLEMAWPESAPRPIGLQVVSDDGRTGTTVVPEEGGRLALGAGGHTLTFTAGPAFVEQVVRIDLDDDELVDLGVSLPVRFEPGPRVLISLAWPADRSRRWRGTNTATLYDAWGAGLRFVVTAAEDEIANLGGALTGLPTMLVENGSGTFSDDGWQVITWPWNANDKRSGHGAIDPSGLGASDLLATTMGSPDKPRTAVVDLAFFEQVGEPWETAPWPAHVSLPHPGPDGPLAAWQPWLRWLDAGAAVTPVAPFAWVEVPDPTAPSKTDVRLGLSRGALCGTTGPLLIARVGSAGPGQVVSTLDLLPTDEVVVTAVGVDSLDHLVLLTGTTVLARWTPTDDRLDATVPIGADVDYVLLAGWDDAGAHWAASAPVWIHPPAGAPPVSTAP